MLRDSNIVMAKYKEEKYFNNPHSKKSAAVY